MLRPLACIRRRPLAATIEAQIFSKEMKRNGAGLLHAQKGVALIRFKR